MNALKTRIAAFAMMLCLGATSMPTTETAVVCLQQSRLATIATIDEAAADLDCGNLRHERFMAILPEQPAARRRRAIFDYRR